MTARYVPFQRTLALERYRLIMSALYGSGGGGKAHTADSGSRIPYDEESFGGPDESMMVLTAGPTGLVAVGPGIGARCG